MAEQTPPRPKRVPRTAQVVSKTTLTPNMVRIVFGGEGLAGFGAGAFTDHYVKLQVPDPASGEAPRAPGPTRSARWDEDARRADDRLRRPRRRGLRRPVGAARAAGRHHQLERPRRRLRAGPGRRVAPDGRRPVGPARDRRVAGADPGGRAGARAGGGRLRRRRAAARVARRPARHLRARRPRVDRRRGRVLHLPGGPGQRVRPRRGVDGPGGPQAPAGRSGDRREAISVSGYWKQTRTEEGWREDKAEWNRLAEAGRGRRRVIRQLAVGAGAA